MFALHGSLSPLSLQLAADMVDEPWEAETEQNSYRVLIGIVFRAYCLAKGPGGDGFWETLETGPKTKNRAVLRP